MLRSIGRVAFVLVLFLIMLTLSLAAFFAAATTFATDGTAALVYWIIGLAFTVVTCFLVIALSDATLRVGGDDRER